MCIDRNSLQEKTQRLPVNRSNHLGGHAGMAQQGQSKVSRGPGLMFQRERCIKERAR
jgi:hypothetical protein